jgi:hypothetical protein
VDPALVDWLITGGLGPALVALPVNWSARRLGGLAHRWMDRIRHEDGLSRLIQPPDSPVKLARSEVAAVRRLLEDPKTWRLIAGGPVEDLAAAIAACLPEFTDAGGDRAAAGRAIARGLLEFAAFDLEPALFQRVLMARITRLEAGQAARLDHVMLQLHAGLTAWFVYQSEADELRARRILAQLGRVLDRLPPGVAGWGEVCVYLAELIEWLNADPWPRDPRFGGKVLSQTGIERELTISSPGEASLDADDLTSRCSRLVVLGGPGSGKTWLARRAARRCAEAALQALSAGASLDDVELPLFTTCSLLVAATGNIRVAVVSSALDQLGDLGGSRIIEALQEFFTERNSPTLLVIDSLDEARSPDDRLRQADTLPWRIILTSRPNSWKQQLRIAALDPSRRIGSLQPLRYPDDVEQFIGSWFTSDQARGRALVMQISSRQDLQQAATVPLILAFYCIIAAEADLPGTPHELHAHVLWQLLSGIWRGVGGEHANPRDQAARLRDWAWEAATKDERTGIGTWADEIVTPYSELSPQDRAALDHLATPIRAPALATGATSRRFVHRSLREYLTAEHVATRMNASQAADELLNHLWYDPDWEYTAPAALAMHKDRDQVLKQLICQTAQPSRVPEDLACLDGCWELRRFLARVASESNEAGWAPESAAIIGQARLDVAGHDLSDLPSAAGWPTTNSQIRRGLLKQLEAAASPSAGWSPDATETAAQLAGVLAGLGADPGEQAQARSYVLDLLNHAWPWEAGRLANVLGELDPGPGDLTRVRSRLLDLLDLIDSGDSKYCAALVSVLGELSPEPCDLARARGRVLDLLSTASYPGDAGLIADALSDLDPGPADLARARSAILDVIAVKPSLAQEQVATLSRLDPEPAELTRARAAVLDLIDAARPSDSVSLAAALARHAPQSEDLARARNRVLDLLDAATDTDTYDAHELTRALVMLAPEAADLARARNRVLDLLDAAAPGYAESLAQIVGELGLPGDLARARRRVLDLLDAAEPYWGPVGASALRRLAPEPADLARARSRALDLLDAAAPGYAESLVRMASALGLEPGDLARARSRVLDLLDAADPWYARELTRTLGHLEPQTADLARARRRVLDMLDASDPSNAWAALVVLGQLNPERGDLARARSRVLAMLDVAEIAAGRSLADHLAELDPEPDDLARARGRVMSMLHAAGPDDGEHCGPLAIALAELGPEPGDLARARSQVLRLLGGRPVHTEELTRALSRLRPVACDLATSGSWTSAPGRELLETVRRNSPRQAWLEILPALANLNI